MTAYHNWDNRINNLSHYGIECDKIIFTSHADKVDEIIKLKPDVVIDDCPQHINQLALSVDIKVKLIVPSLWNYKQEVKPNMDNVFYYDSIEHLAKILEK